MAEVLFHFGRTKNLKPCVMRINGDTHWYIIDKRGKVYDPTVEQFKKKPDYSKGRGCGFLTKQPSKRAVLLMERLKNA